MAIINRPSCSDHGALFVVGPVVQAIEKNGWHYGLRQVFTCVKCGARLELPLPPNVEPPDRPRVVAVFPDGSWIEDGPSGRSHVSNDDGR